MTAFLHGQSKIFFFSKKRYSKTNILRLSNSKATSKDKRYLLMSYNVNDVTECAPCDDNGNVTLMAQAFYFAFHNFTNAPIVFSSQ